MVDKFEEVTAEDFSKITQNMLPHQLIENTLVDWGGKGVKGIKFKNLMIKYAGWSRSSNTSYSKDPTQAAIAFNNIRKALSSCSNAEELKSKLEPNR